MRYGRRGKYDSLRSFGKFEKSGKIVTRGKRRKRWRGEHIGIRRIGELRKWKIREIGSLGRLGISGVSENWEIRGNSEIPELRKSLLKTPEE